MVNSDIYIRMTSDGACDLPHPSSPAPSFFFLSVFFLHTVIVYFSDNVNYGIIPFYFFSTCIFMFLTVTNNNKYKQCHFIEFIYSFIYFFLILLFVFVSLSKNTTYSPMSIRIPLFKHFAIE